MAWHPNMPATAFLKQTNDKVENLNPNKCLGGLLACLYTRALQSLVSNSALCQVFVCKVTMLES